VGFYPPLCILPTVKRGKGGKKVREEETGRAKRGGFFLSFSTVVCTSDWKMRKGEEKRVKKSIRE